MVCGSPYLCHCGLRKLGILWARWMLSLSDSAIRYRCSLMASTAAAGLCAAIIYLLVPAAQGAVANELHLGCDGYEIYLSNYKVYRIPLPQPCLCYY